MLNVDKVKSVYSGRKGCACGCRGKYSYASRHADKRPSYYDGNTGVSDRSVRLICSHVEQRLREGTEVEHVIVDEGGDWIVVDMVSDRTYTVYFE